MIKYSMIYRDCFRFNYVFVIADEHVSTQLSIDSYAILIENIVSFLSTLIMDIKQRAIEIQIRAISATLRNAFFFLFAFVRSRFYLRTLPQMYCIIPHCY